MKHLKVAILGYGLALGQATAKALASELVDCVVIEPEPTYEAVELVSPEETYATQIDRYQDRIQSLVEVYPDYLESHSPQTIELQLRDHLTPYMLDGFDSAFILTQEKPLFWNPCNSTKSRSFDNDARRVPAWCGATQSAVHS